MRNFLTRLFHWEFWPVYVTNVPTIVFWLYFGARRGNLFFFSTVNPVIETGGVLGESKINILRRFPESSIPKTIFFSASELDVNFIKRKLEDQNFHYPLIVKPDVGERGFMVEKIHNFEQLESYLEAVKVNIIIQEYIDYPCELSILYYRIPGERNGQITSVCIKKHLAVTGDGRSTISTLMQVNKRALLQLPRLEREKPYLLRKIIPKGQKYIVEPIGNHCRGTLFLNGNHLINQDLTNVINNLGQNLDGIYYGRFDLKCKSIADLEADKNYAIMEFNGVASEPAHIYDPEYSIIKAYSDIYQHWKIIYSISKIQSQRGVKSMSWKEARGSVARYFRYMRNARQKQRASLNIS